MTKEKIVRNNIYTDEEERLILPEWMFGCRIKVPRLKAEYRKAPNAPWSPSESALAELKEKKEALAKVDEQERKRICK